MAAISQWVCVFMAKLSPAMWALFLCALGFGLDQMELQLGGALAAIFSTAPYSLEPQRLSWLIGSVYVGGCICTPLVGRVADRHGLRRTLCWTLVWLGITSLLSCLRDDPTWLSAFRVLIGISLGAYPPLMVAYLTSIAPESQRGRWIFWACGLAYFAAPVSLFALRFLTASPPAGLAGWRWLSVAIGVLSMITGYLFTHLPEPVKSQAVSSSSQPGAVGMLLRPPLRRTFILVAALYFLYPWATTSFSLLTGPLLLQRGFTLSNALWYVSFAAVAPAFATLAAAWVIDSAPRRTATLSCCAIMLSAALCFFTGDTALTLSSALVAFGVGRAIYPGAFMTLGAESFPADLRATATSTAWALNRLAAFLVPVALLPLLNSSGPMSVAVCVTGALILSTGITFGIGAVDFRKDAQTEPAT